MCFDCHLYVFIVMSYDWYLSLFEIKVFWQWILRLWTDITVCSSTHGCHCFRGACCVHLLDRRPRRWRQQVTEIFLPDTELYSIASQNLSCLVSAWFSRYSKYCFYLNIRCPCLCGDPPFTHLSFQENTCFILIIEMQVFPVWWKVRF